MQKKILLFPRAKIVYISRTVEFCIIINGTKTAPRNNPINLEFPVEFAFMHEIF